MQCRCCTQSNWILLIKCKLPPRWKGFYRSPNLCNVLNSTFYPFWPVNIPVQQTSEYRRPTLPQTFLWDLFNPPRPSPAVHLLWKQCCVWRGALCEDDSWSAFGLLWWLHRESLCEANINSQPPNQRCLATYWNILTDPEIGVQSYFLSYISSKIRIFTILVFIKPRQHKDSKKVGFITMIWSINTQRLKAVKEFESKPKRWVESIWCQPSLGHYA